MPQPASQILEIMSLNNYAFTLFPCGFSETQGRQFQGGFRKLLIFNAVFLIANGYA
jgi:hypothetical protein